MARLTDICAIQYGYAFDSSLFSATEGIPLVRIRDVIRGYSDTFTTETCNANYYVENGDILIGMDGDFNIAYWQGGHAYLNQRVCKIIPSESVDTGYLFYQMNPILKEIEAKTPFVTVKHLSAKELNKVELVLPDLPAQRRIAATLDKVSEGIDLCRKMLADLDELVKARFVEMFGTETELDIWPCCTIGDVADVCVGVVIKPTQYYTDKGIPAFRSLNIGEMRVKDSDWVYFSEEGHQKNQKSVVHKNDVLVVRSGAPGTACVATDKYDGYNAVDIIIAHPDNSKVNSTFLAAFTNMPHGMNQIRERTGGAAQQHFNVGGYKAMRLIMPSIELQNQFAAFVAKVNKSRFAVQQQLSALETLKKSLMQKYFG